MGKSSEGKVEALDSESVKGQKDLMGQMVEGFESVSNKYDSFADIGTC